jgi:hypothetical protein
MNSIIQNINDECYEMGEELDLFIKELLYVWWWLFNEYNKENESLSIVEKNVLNWKVDIKLMCL